MAAIQGWCDELGMASLRVTCCYMEQPGQAPRGGWGAGLTMLRDQGEAVGASSLGFPGVLGRWEQQTSQEAGGWDNRVLVVHPQAVQGLPQKSPLGPP